MRIGEIRIGEMSRRRLNVVLQDTAGECSCCSQSSIVSYVKNVMCLDGLYMVHVYVTKASKS